MVYVLRIYLSMERLLYAKHQPAPMASATCTTVMERRLAIPSRKRIHIDCLSHTIVILAVKKESLHLLVLETHHVLPAVKMMLRLPFAFEMREDYSHPLQ
jgi:hypothetical protein